MIHDSCNSNYFCMFLQVINFSSTTIAVFIGVVGILSIVAQVTHTNTPEDICTLFTLTSHLHSSFQVSYVLDVLFMHIWLHIALQYVSSSAFLIANVLDFPHYV